MEERQSFALIRFRCHVPPGPEDDPGDSVIRSRLLYVLQNQELRGFEPLDGDAEIVVVDVCVEDDPRRTGEAHGQQVVHGRGHFPAHKVRTGRLLISSLSLSLSCPLISTARTFDKK